MRIHLTIFLILAQILLLAQKNKEKDILISGTVYTKSSISPGVMGMNSIEQGEAPFKHQTIYFQCDSLPMVNATTDSLGKFSLKLKPGSYTVHQSEGLKPQRTPGLNYFGTANITVNSDSKGPFTIIFENRSNRRQTMGGKGIPGSKTPTQKTTSKN